MKINAKNVQINCGPILPELMSILANGIDFSDLDCVQQIKDPFGIGDLMNAVELQFDKTYAEIEDITGLSRSTLYSYKWICKKFPPNQRKWKLPLAFYKSVTKLPKKDWKSFMDVAEKSEMSLREFRTTINKAIRKRNK